VPPPPVAVRVPVEPVQTMAGPETLAVSGVGWVMVVDAVAIHPLLSITVMVYVPALRPVAVELVLAMGDHW
jgi:hypothetical protein